MPIVGLHLDALLAAQSVDRRRLREHDHAHRLVLLVERQQPDGVVQLRRRGLCVRAARETHHGADGQLGGERDDRQAGRAQRAAQRGLPRAPPRALADLVQREEPAAVLRAVVHPD